MALTVLINLLLALFWAAIAQAATPAEFGVDFLVGYLVGFAILALFEPDYPRRSLRGIGYLIFLIWEIIKSNFILAWYIIRPDTRSKLHPAIMAVPLDSDTDLELTLLASSITLTPGTISVDTGYDAHGRRVLFVHDLLLDDPVEFQKQMQGFERKILAFTRGAPSHE